MVKNISESSSMIRDTVMVFSSGQMEDNMKDSGLKASSMALEYIEIKMEKVERENGLKERELDGWIDEIEKFS
jgi:hypothetical protein